MVNSSPQAGGSKARKIIINEAQTEESEQQLREFLNGGDTRRIKRKTESTSR